MDSIIDYQSSSDDEETTTLSEKSSNITLDNNEIAQSHHLCMVCKLHDRKYKCPACHLSTCSLVCCKQHKVMFQCNGKRNRADYIRMSEYKEKNLIADYHFLEDVLNTKRRGKQLLGL